MNRKELLNIMRRIRNAPNKSQRILILEEWLDMERTYLPEERARDVRLDCKPMRGEPALV